MSNVAVVSAEPLRVSEESMPFYTQEPKLLFSRTNQTTICKSSKNSRNRGVILSQQGLQKLIQAGVLYDDYGRRYTHEELSERALLDARTVSRILGCEVRVDKRTLKTFFRAFSLHLDINDYVLPKAPSLDASSVWCRVSINDKEGMLTFNFNSQESPVSNLALQHSQITGILDESFEHGVDFFGFILGEQNQPQIQFLFEYMDAQGNPQTAKIVIKRDFSRDL